MCGDRIKTLSKSLMSAGRGKAAKAGRDCHGGCGVLGAAGLVGVLRVQEAGGLMGFWRVLGAGGLARGPRDSEG